MAMNVYRALLEEYGTQRIDMDAVAVNLHHAIDYAIAFGSLRNEDYLALSMWCNQTMQMIGAMRAQLDAVGPRTKAARKLRDDIRRLEIQQRDALQYIIMQMLDYYAVEWKKRGMPMTSEEWAFATIPEDPPAPTDDDTEKELYALVMNDEHGIPDDSGPEYHQYGCYYSGEDCEVGCNCRGCAEYTPRLHYEEDYDG